MTRLKLGEGAGGAEEAGRVHICNEWFEAVARHTRGASVDKSPTVLSANAFSRQLSAYRRAFAIAHPELSRSIKACS
jgi:hypothetical protein